MLTNDYPKLFRQAIAYIVAVILLWWFVFTVLQNSVTGS